MLVLEAKLEGSSEQYTILDEMIRTARFIRNSCVRYWMDNRDVGKNEISAYTAILASLYEWAGKLNSMARQASGERAWQSINRFYSNCKKKVPGKKGYPKFRREQTHGSVEYKTTGYKLSKDRRSITFTDKFDAGTFKMWGTRDLHFYQLNQIKRVRVVRRADGYYCQFCVDQERLEKREPTQTTVGLDVGLNHFYTDSKGNTVENPRYLRKGEKALKRLQKRVSRKKKGSSNRTKARKKLALKHLKVSRQRKDFAVKLARCVVISNDVVAYEDLKVRNMVKNTKLAKSISDAAWSLFRQCVEYFGKVFGVATVAVPPHNTSQNCSHCGNKVQKSLSTRTHRCPHCGTVLDRDPSGSQSPTEGDPPAALSHHNAALNILEIALRTVGHTGTKTSGDENDLCLGEETPSGKPTRGTRKSKAQVLESHGFLSK
ncbi:RNA-guided endonuclease InsQ/TnpB family protein [Brasilonema bromeliae]|uniref:Transposase n=1 Tax=Brasilonema bromeliae SPC951 TaxID=385972 RepID=A0ABX1PG30_9CYAN|nr:RNA-guided endonuclease TnpB family protein [Brasilonema bromeliae]NMG22445.1 transposase [Brasilonema bromeliae SPC951]